MDDARVDGVPWLDVMAAEGVQFSSAYATEPQCGPSRAALLSGRYRTVEVNGTTAGLDVTDTLGTRMQAAGYETAYVGKYLNGHTETGAPPGWDRWLVFQGAPHYFGYELQDELGSVSAPSAYSTDYLALEVGTFLEASQGPAFALWAPYAPHIDGIQSLLPVPAPRHVGAFDSIPDHLPPSLNHRVGKPAYLQASGGTTTEPIRRRGMEATLSVAEAIEELRAAFPALVVIVTSDNGAGWGEHGWHFQQKNCPHRICTRIPFVVFGPWEPKQVAAPIRLEDLTATVLDLGGASMAELDGRSLVGLLWDGDEAYWPRTSLPFHYGGSRFGGPAPRWDAVLDFAGERLTASYETGELEAYDLAADPWLLTNLAVLPEPDRWLLQLVAVLTVLLVSAPRRTRLRPTDRWPRHSLDG